MNTVRTVSDTKRAFYGAHTNPINSIYRRVVDELMVEMHLLTVNQHFVYSPIYALGVVTTFDRFMQGYRPESDVNSIFQALCSAVGGDAVQYRHDAEQLQQGLTGVQWSQLVQMDAAGSAVDAVKHVVGATNFKYTRLFAIGLYTMLEQVDEAASQDDEQRTVRLSEIADAMSLSSERVEKDLELYRGNLEKMAQAQQAIADTIAAERKRREQREQEKANSAVDKSEDVAAADQDAAENASDAGDTPSDNI